MTAPRPRRPWLLPLGVFFGVWLIHSASPVYNVFDSRWTLQTAMSLRCEHDADLDEYAASVEPGDYRVQQAGGHLYNVYPLGPALVALPFLCVADPVLQAGLGMDLGDVLAVRSIGRLEVIIASFTVALTAMMIFLLALEMLKSRKLALVAALIFAFGTSAWSVASRGLWQHGPTMLLLSVALWLLVTAQRRPWGVWLSALPLGLSLVMRPNSIIPIAVFSLYVLIAHRRAFGWYLLIGLAVLGPFLAFNRATCGTWLPWYYTGQWGRVGEESDLLAGLAGCLFSPARGLFIYSPVLLFSMVGIIARRQRQGRLEGLDWAVLGVLGAHLLVISAWPVWWGGHCYGPRLLADMLPFLIYLLIPALGLIAHPQGASGRLLLGVFIIFALWSVTLHLQGAANWATVYWNVDPANVDSQPWRLWDWSDPPFLRGL